MQQLGGKTIEWILMFNLSTAPSQKRKRRPLSMLTPITRTSFPV